MIIVLMLFSMFTFGQESTTSVQVASTNAQMRALIEGLSKVAPEEFPTRVESLRSEIDKFIVQKKRVCDGVFSTMILQSNITTNENKKGERLSNEERKLCYRELKSLQLNFVDGLFEARKRYLSYLHEKRLKEISIAHEETIKEINRTFQSK